MSLRRFRQSELRIRKQRHNGNRITIYEGTACGGCLLKSQCTTADKRFVSRHFAEDAYARTKARLDAEPHMMRLRSAIVEYPFGNPKRWVFGDAHYLVRGIKKVKGETALAVLACNLRRMTNIATMAEMKSAMAA